MRTRPILKEWTSWTGKHCEADIDATMAMLAESCPEDQENDAYWQATDILNKNGSTSFEELMEKVTADSGFLNKGCVLKSGKGRAFWERKDKELCIRWAIADHNYIADPNYYGEHKMQNDNESKNNKEGRNVQGGRHLAPQTDRRA